MGDEKQQQIINERFAQLPEVVQNTISDSDWQSKIRFIVDKNNLLLDQGLVIETETFLMMLGLSDPKDYVQNIQRSAQLSKDQAVQIALEVDDQILKEIRKKIIEESEKITGINHDPMDEILGLNKELEKVLPAIDVKTSAETTNNISPIQKEYAEQERESLISEISDDIKIDPDFTPEEDNNPETLEGSGLTNGFSKKTTIPDENFKVDKSRLIETETGYASDNLPNLNPIRTLEGDTKQNEVVGKNNNPTPAKPIQIKTEATLVEPMTPEKSEPLKVPEKELTTQPMQPVRPAPTPIMQTANPAPTPAPQIQKQPAPNQDPYREPVVE